MTPSQIAGKVFRRISRGMTPIKPYLRPANVVCFHAGRVGSTVLGSQLNQHPRICWRGEVFWRDAKRHLQAADVESFTALDDPRRQLRRESHKAAMRIFGCEIKYSDLEMYDLSIAELLPWLRRNAITHFILQRRRNVLRQLVSGLIVARRNRWRQLQGEAPILTRLRLDPLAVNGSARDLREVLERLTSLHGDALRDLKGERLLELTYEEDIESDPRIGYHKVCDFLGVERVASSIDDCRMNPFPVSEMLENFEEVARYLQDTPYAWMVDD